MIFSWGFYTALSLITMKATKDYYFKGQSKYRNIVCYVVWLITGLSWIILTNKTFPVIFQKVIDIAN